MNKIQAAASAAFFFFFWLKGKLKYSEASLLSLRQTLGFFQELYFVVTWVAAIFWQKCYEEKWEVKWENKGEFEGDKRENTTRVWKEKKEEQ